MANNIKKNARRTVAIISVELLLIILKAFGIIGWSWVWITLPFWGVFGLVSIWILMTATIKTLKKNLKWKQAQKNIDK